MVPMEFPYRLSPRQKEVLGLLMEGKSNADMAEILNLKEGSIKTHVHAILRRMRVTSRAQAVAVATKYNSELETRSDERKFQELVLA